MYEDDDYERDFNDNMPDPEFTRDPRPINNEKEIWMSRIKDLEDEIAESDQAIRELRKTIEDLRRENKELEAEVYRLKLKLHIITHVEK